MISGKVFDKAGNPLTGVTVRVQNGASTLTDATGTFQIAAKNGDKLNFEFLGFEPFQLLVTDKDSYTVAMNEAIDELEEVVVVGYGTQLKANLSGAISEIKGEELTRRPVSSVQQALQGQVSGLTILDRGGAPGKSSTTMRVRGVTTIGNNNHSLLLMGLNRAWTI